jgi:hypothetical protein
MFPCITKTCMVAILATFTGLPGAQETGEGIAVARYAGLVPDAFMTRWLACGPFPVLEGQQKPEEAVLRQAFDRDFLAGHGGESGIQPTLGTMQGPCRWQLVSAVRDIVDLATLCVPKDFAVA